VSEGAIEKANYFAFVGLEPAERCNFLSLEKLRVSCDQRSYERSKLEKAGSSPLGSTSVNKSCPAQDFSLRKAERCESTLPRAMDREPGSRTTTAHLT